MFATFVTQIEKDNVANLLLHSGRGDNETRQGKVRICDIE